MACRIVLLFLAAAFTVSARTATLGEPVSPMLTVTVRNVDFKLLEANQSLKHDFIDTVKTTVAEKAGDKIKAEHVKDFMKMVKAEVVQVAGEMITSEHVTDLIDEIKAAVVEPAGEKIAAASEHATAVLKSINASVAEAAAVKTVVERATDLMNTVITSVAKAARKVIAAEHVTDYMNTTDATDAIDATVPETAGETIAAENLSAAMNATNAIVDEAVGGVILAERVSGFINTIKATVAKAVAGGEAITAENVTVTLVEELPEAIMEIALPQGVSSATLSSDVDGSGDLASSLTKALSAIDGIVAVVSGELSVAFANITSELQTARTSYTTEQGSVHVSAASGTGISSFAITTLALGAIKWSLNVYF